jgi:hypothetical protein
MYNLARGDNAIRHTFAHSRLYVSFAQSSSVVPYSLPQRQMLLKHSHSLSSSPLPSASSLSSMSPSTLPSAWSSASLIRLGSGFCLHTCTFIVYPLSKQLTQCYIMNVQITGEVHVATQKQATTLFYTSFDAHTSSSLIKSAASMLMLRLSRL